jgi:hypothetical protein
MGGDNSGDLEHFSSRLFSKMDGMVDRQSEHLENNLGSFMVEVESKMDKNINVLNTRWEERVASMEKTWEECFSFHSAPPSAAGSIAEDDFTAIG